MTMKSLAALATLLLAPVAVARAQRTDNPHGRGIGPCAPCHAPDSWRPVRISKEFRHAERSFPLEGAHVRTACTACHKNLIFDKVTSTCASCHSDVHGGELGTDCARCHTPRSFVDQGQLRRMHELTRLPLRGAHAAARCDACHTPSVSRQSQYRGRPTTCIGCHAVDYRQAKSPDHVVAQFSQDCTACHGNSSWQDARFDHSATRFALRGAHKAVACSSCHADKVFRGTTMECVGCHQADYDRSVNPPHAPGFPTTCATCHSSVSWQDTKFDHNATRFALTGAHRTTTCVSCHGDRVYRGKPMECVSCHQRNYTASVIPPHAALAFPTVCATCHTTTAWPGGSYDHTVTKFPLTGAHRTVTCTSCHGDKVYRGKPMACASCHQAKFAVTTSPPHASSGFPNTCENCHTTNGWTPATFNHANTQFPLLGAHAATLCQACHADGVYKGKPTACISCHQKDYSGAIPSHSTLGYSTVCTNCHKSMTTWAGGSINHQLFPFPLTGAHLAVACNACHADGVYKGKSMACASCHQTRYAATTNPPHVAAGFGITCETCHTTASWLTATFNHSTTKFPLTGAHVPLACSSCHADGVYVGKPTVCSSCHLAKYAATTNPVHTAAGFPTTCEQCHTTTTWLGATFNHDASFFPIYSGKHNGKWSVCADCHTSPSNYAVFSCFQCHLKPAMDSKHQGRAGYKYDSPTCYSCHPRGSAG